MEENPQSHAVTVELHHDVARALWPACYDDDDLVSFFLHMAVVHSLNHLIDQVPSAAYPKDKAQRLAHHLKYARRMVDESLDEMQERFNTYIEPPF
jgi:hypothetical protein